MLLQLVVWACSGGFFRCLVGVCDDRAAMNADPVQVGAQRAPRPVNVTVVAALALVFGLDLVVTGVLSLLGADGEQSEVVDGVVNLASAGVAFVVAIGAFGLRRWAWILFMSWAVVALTLQLVRVFFYDDAHYTRLVLGTVAVFLLTPLDTQVAFGVRSPPSVRIDSPSASSVDGV